MSLSFVMKDGGRANRESVGANLARSIGLKADRQSHDAKEKLRGVQPIRGRGGGRGRGRGGRGRKVPKPA
jgi:hypothetical protein